MEKIFVTKPALPEYEEYVEEIKSIYNVRICFIEESQTLTQRSYEILEPSIRADKSEIWLALIRLNKNVLTSSSCPPDSHPSLLR